MGFPLAEAQRTLEQARLAQEERERSEKKQARDWLAHPKTQEFIVRVKKVIPTLENVGNMEQVYIGQGLIKSLRIIEQMTGKEIK